MIGRLVLTLAVLAAAVTARADIPPPPPPPPAQPTMPVLGIAPPATGQIAIAGVLLALGAISAGLALARRQPGAASLLKAAGLAVAVGLLAFAGLLATWSRRVQADHQRQRAELERGYAERRRNWQPRGPVEPWQNAPESAPAAPAAPPEGAPTP